jgi:hypothetical protein
MTKTVVSKDEGRKRSRVRRWCWAPSQNVWSFAGTVNAARLKDDAWMRNMKLRLGSAY